MFMEVCLTGLGIHVADKAAKIREDEEMVQNATPTSLSGLQKVHEVLSCLIRGVYMVDKADHRDSASQFWTNVGYEPVDLNTLNLTGADYDNNRDQFKKDLTRIADTPRPTTPGSDLASVARLVLFRRCEGTGHDERLIDAGVYPEKAVLRPKYVVAIRGTMLRRLDRSFNKLDLVADTKILFETFHKAKDLHEPVGRLVKAICKQDGAGVDCVWIAGHSLGAMIALQATRELALLETTPKLVLCTHLFNVPHCSIFGVARVVGQSIAKGIAKPLNNPFFSSKLPDFDGLMEDMGTVVQDYAYKFAEWKDREAIKQLREESSKLMDRNYFPYLYLNPNDPISRGYMGHFGVEPTDVAGEPTEALPATMSRSHSLSSSFLRCLNIDAKSCYRIGHARLIINHWGKGPKQAHKLHQWFLYPTINRKVYQTLKSVELE